MLNSFLQMGMGSYGIVYKGKLHGTDVAVKRLINQNMNEKRMLDFRSETALFSQLSHPNVIRVIGFLLSSYTDLYYFS